MILNRTNISRKALFSFVMYNQADSQVIMQQPSEITLFFNLIQKCNTGCRYVYMHDSNEHTCTCITLPNGKTVYV